METSAFVKDIIVTITEKEGILSASSDLNDHLIGTVRDINAQQLIIERPEAYKEIGRASCRKRV